MKPHYLITLKDDDSRFYYNMFLPAGSEIYWNEEQECFKQTRGDGFVWSISLKAAEESTERFKIIYHV